MKLKYGILAGALTLAVAGAPMAQAATSAQIDSQFRATISRVLDSIKDQDAFLSGLSSAEYRQFVRCAQSVMDGAFRPQKQYVMAVRNLSAQRARFNEVANRRPIDGQDTLKQKIAQKCN